MSNSPLVGVVMGSQSDWQTMQVCTNTLQHLEIPFEKKIVSAHRTPDYMFEYAQKALGRGLHYIIAGAGGAAHLPGMLASKTILPVIGVPIKSRALNGVDSLLSIAQMPGGVPVATMSIGDSGAKNAALYAARCLAHNFPNIKENIQAYMEEQTQTVLNNSTPGE